MKKILQCGAVALIVMALASCYKKNNNGYNTPPDPAVNANVFVISGDSLGIAGKIADFKNTLGAGQFGVNWDAVPANLSDVDNFPGDFFGSSDAAAPAARKRGLIMSGAPGFRVSSNDFNDIDASYNAQFNAFSKTKTFMSSGSVSSDMAFDVPGTLTPGFIKGFGVVFCDVDVANSTTLEFFNGARSLGVYNAPLRTAGGEFSFLGVFFPDEKVTRVRIKSGAAPLVAGLKDKSDGGVNDLVVMDDFFYSSPLILQ